VKQSSFKDLLRQRKQAALKIKKMFLICLPDEEITILRIL